MKERKKAEVLARVKMPAKLSFLPDFVFRQSKPAIIGVEVLAGTLQQKVDLMDEEGKIVGTVHAIQKMGENVGKADIGERVVISADGGVVDRNLKRGAIYYTALSNDDYRLLTENAELLADNHRVALEAIAEIRRKKAQLRDVY